ncbi:MAG: ribonuclease III [Clostridia bacterium]|nr:ribonuclease III [Clostridia bacterium]
MNVTEILTSVPERDAYQMNPVTLAFLGDAVLTLYIREKLALIADYPSGDLQKYTAIEVSAHGQNIALAKVGPAFTATEKEIFRRGRNSKKPAKAKNATVAEYNNSTGFEAVLGYLYISGQYERLDEILKLACGDLKAELGLDSQAGAEDTE